jgi:hypothetical protein
MSLNLKPKSEILAYFKSISSFDVKRVMGTTASNIISFYVRLNTLPQSSKIEKMVYFIRQLSTYTEFVWSDFIITTINTYYPDYVKTKDLLNLYVSINNKLKENCVKVITSCVYDLANQNSLSTLTGSDFLNLLETGTNNNWIKNTPYNRSETDEPSDYMCVIAEPIANLEPIVNPSPYNGPPLANPSPYNGPPLANPSPYNGPPLANPEPTDKPSIIPTLPGFYYHYAGEPGFSFFSLEPIHQWVTAQINI